MFDHRTMRTRVVGESGRSRILRWTAALFPWQKLSDRAVERHSRARCFWPLDIADVFSWCLHWREWLVPVSSGRNDRPLLWQCVADNSFGVVRGWDALLLNCECRPLLMRFASTPLASRSIMPAMSSSPSLELPSKKSAVLMPRSA
jgi:hypothetical protein